MIKKLLKLIWWPIYHKNIVEANGRYSIRYTYFIFFHSFQDFVDTHVTWTASSKYYKSDCWVNDIETARQMMNYDDVKVVE